MDDLIKRQDAIDAIDKDIMGGLNYERILREVPSAEPEQKIGKWQITDAYPHNVYCSECHKRFAQTQWSVWEDGSLPRNYCPNCGARMECEEE